MCSKRPIGVRQPIDKIAPVDATEIRRSGGPVGEHRVRSDVVLLYFREITAKVVGAVLNAEGGLDMLCPRRAPELLKMSFSIRYGDQSPAWAKYSRQLHQSLVQGRNMVKHPGGDHGVKRTVREREIANVGQNRGDAERATHGDHGGRGIDSDDLAFNRFSNPDGEGSFARTNLKNAVGMNLT
jgi:hypothetical protein